MGLEHGTGRRGIFSVNVTEVEKGLLYGGKKVKEHAFGTRL